MAYKYAGFWVRTGAALIDSIILLILITPLIYGVEYLNLHNFLRKFCYLIFNWVVPAITVVLFWQWKLATPGKMAFSVIIVDEKTGNKPTLKQWIIRYLGYFLSTIPLCIGCFWVGWDKKKQGWHDKLAKTVVIRPKKKGVDDGAL